MFGGGGIMVHAMNNELGSALNPEKAKSPFPKITATTDIDVEEDSGFIFPSSDKQLLSDNDLSSLNSIELRIARNEIFARKGRHFHSPDLIRYFEGKEWYKPTTWEPILNDIEISNALKIRAYEK